MKTETIVLTPEKAAELIKGNTKNRPIIKPHVEHLARQMSDGKWKENGDAIRMSRSGILMDGQHRLLAVIRSGASVKVNLVSELDEDVITTIDTGRTKKVSDFAAMNGEKNANSLASAACICMRYEAGRVSLFQGRYAPDDVLAFIESNPLIRTSTSLCIRARIAPPSLLAAAHFIFSQKDTAQADWFMDQLIGGAGIVTGSPIHKLRERLMSNAVSKTKITRDYIMALTIKAWNAHRAGKSLGCLKVQGGMATKEQFPRAI